MNPPLIKIKFRFLYYFILIFLFSLPSTFSQTGWTLLFSEDFESSYARLWELGSGWTVESDNSSNVLSGTEHYFAIPQVNGWENYSLDFQFRLIAGDFHTNIRETTSGEHNRYFVSVAADKIRLHRQQGLTFEQLAVVDVVIISEVWQNLKIVVDSQSIVVTHNDVTVIEYTDSDQPLYFGRFSFESLDYSHVHIDNILVLGEAIDESEHTWIRTGGPSGGLGYDVRIHPLNKDIVFVTDNPSGINKSSDGGKSWKQKNTGITTIAGDSNDGIPIFSLTIDPGEPNIVWAGTQFSRGIYKSVDGGETWIKKDSGIAENIEISFRGFGIHPHESNIVFAGAEITTGILGVEFDKALGKIYRTEDGGEAWTAVWEGNSLVRFIIFDYNHPEILYASTGIFDREAINITGEGIIKSDDGGFNWFPINNGIPDSAGHRFVGFIEMHPYEPQILFAASGNNATGKGGLYKTDDGGANWNRVLSDDIFTIVTISSVNPDVVYAGSFKAFYRSNDGGITWDTLSKAGGGYGPPGIVAGVPISAVVDPEDPYIIFANNYNGGNFKSVNGAVSWINSSDGYTGASLLDISIDPQNPEIVCAIGRSGPFRSINGGEDWAGITYAPAISPEWYSVSVHPTNNQEILMAGEFDGNMYRTTNGGTSWSVVFDHPLVEGSCPTGPTECRHGFKEIVYAPSNPSIIYAGMCKGRRTINGDFPARGSYGIFKSVNSGITWDTINTGLPMTLLSIDCISVQSNNPDIVYIGTWKDGVYKTTNGGQSWFLASTGLTSSDIRALVIHPSDTSIVYAGTGDGAGVFMSNNGGSSWSVLNTGIDLECPQYLLPFGKTNDGVSLTTPPKFVSNPDYYQAPWTSIRDIVIDPTNPSLMYAADYRTGVYTTSNGGTSWTTMNDSLTMRTATALALSADGSVLYAATFGGGVFRLPLGANHAPQIATINPSNENVLSLDQLDTVKMCVSAYDLDGDYLSYSWTLDGLDWPATDACYEAILNELTPGMHIFEVRINDSDTTTTVAWVMDVSLDVTDTDNQTNLPEEYSLAQNYPNPFNPVTIIKYELPVQSDVTIELFNVLGQKVRTLVNRKEPAGTYTIFWDGTDASGNPVATGLYLYRITAGSFEETRKMLLLK
ncbi:FlgD immunoglobulin-like domain containing protein [Candidatus Zixiibacteriota bacterium]